MGTNQTTAGKAGAGAALGSITVWLVSLFLTEPIPPEATGAIVVLTTWLFCRLVPQA